MQKNSYDLIIVGGGTSGCACAWNSARLGLKTLLLEKNNYLGGAITAQLVVPAMKTDDNTLNTEFFEELCKCSHKENAQITYVDGNKGWFNPLKLPDILHRLLKSVGCDILYNVKCIDAKYNDNIVGEKSKILSICFDANYNDNTLLSKCFEKKYNDNIPGKKRLEFYSKYFIDATGDANFSEIVGAKFLPPEKTQATSLRFIMSNVNKEAFTDWIMAYDTNRNVTTSCTTKGELHFSTAYTWDSNAKWALEPLFNKAVIEGTLKNTDRAYFQIFSIAGEPDKVAFNCPRLFVDEGFDVFSSVDKFTAIEDGKNAIKRLESFCRKYLKGFENAQIYKIADELGIRESRRVKGQYVLTKEDIYAGKQFDNAVAYSNYPIDVHSVKKDEYVLDYVQKAYSIPLESLVVEGFENLFVIGRCISADFYAQAAIRIQPTCFSMGEGLAKHLAML